MKKGILTKKDMQMNVENLDKERICMLCKPSPDMCPYIDI